MQFDDLMRRGAKALRLICVCAAGIGWSQASAQTLGTTDVQSILQGISQGQQVVPGATGTTLPPPPSPPLTPSTQTFQPAPTPPANTTPSGLEQLFSARAGVPLQQFGYDVFGMPGSVTTTQIGALQDSYIMGAGDQVQIIMVGHENATYQVTVDRDGRISLLNLPPVTASGRTFGEVRTDLAARIASQFLNTKSYISVSTVRQISVLVTGEVASPGVRTLSALNSPLDALILSGGIKKTGSLRGVYVLRGGRRMPLDLYSIINRGTSGSVGSLTQGDRIVIPPIGATVAVAGQVGRAGIYELPGGATRITARALMQLAGGMQIAGAKRLSKLELAADGRTRMVSLPAEGTIANGEVLFVDANRSVVSSRTTLSGAVAIPGVHAVGASGMLSGILRDSDDLGPTAYTLFAVIVRHDPSTNFLKLVPFSLKSVFDRTGDIQMVDNDSVYVFSTAEMQALATAAATAVSTAVQAPGVAGLNQQATSTSASSTTTTSSTATPPPTQALTQLGVPAAALAQATSPTAPTSGNVGTAAPTGATTTAPPASTTQPAQSTQTTSQTTQTTNSATSALAPPPGTAASVNSGTISLDDLAQRVGVTTQQLTNLASNYLVWVNGEVLTPGPLLATGGPSLSSILDAAGGLQRQADLSGVTVSSTQIDAQTGSSRTLRNTYAQRDTNFASVILRPFDSVSVRAVFSDRSGESLVISGQVRYPGTYEVTRDERLSSVLARAGGLTDEAYAYGAIFTRQSAAVAEQQANAREAMMLSDEIATISTQQNGILPPPNLSYLQSLAQTLIHQPALGRISISVDPAVLAAHPDRDPLLESGDAIYIPKRPATVAVTGEVLNSGAFAYRPDASIDDYMDLAGGETDAAEDSAIFVVMPDGSAVPAHGSFWSFGRGTRIPVGATIVVPRDPQPFNWTTFLVTYADILSKVAITAASLSVLQKN